MSVPIPLYVETSLAKEPQVAPNTIPFFVIWWLCAIDVLVCVVELLRLKGLTSADYFIFL